MSESEVIVPYKTDWTFVTLVTGPVLFVAVVVLCVVLG